VDGDAEGGEVQSTAQQLVLAGDPKQLGPIVRSSLAKAFGFEVSLLERLMGRDVYARDEHSMATSGGYNSAFVTKLVNNYRSHPAILHLPNGLFYDGDLVACADHSTISHVLTSWEHFPKGIKPDFPVIFHGVEGEDKREGSSPSWFNSDEVQVVRNYVKLLTQDTRTNRPEPKDIGVITPYSKQSQKVRQCFATEGERLRDLTVGSVEQFQGQERKVIIVSTVRSTQEYVEFDAPLLGVSDQPEAVQRGGHAGPGAVGGGGQSDSAGGGRVLGCAAVVLCGSWGVHGVAAAGSAGGGGGGGGGC
jgi:superfamily I DNA and/or RNA helicase